MGIIYCLKVALRPSFSTEPKGIELIVRHVPITCTRLSLKHHQ